MTYRYSVASTLETRDGTQQLGLASTDAGVFLDGNGAISGGLALMHRGMSIAGGTSEIKRNQIGERILNLPRDPLIR